MTILEYLEPMFLIKAAGLLGVFAIIFAESGLFFGFFFPGDSLLFAAGFLASQGILPIGWLALGCFLAAVVGDSVGYAFGKTVGAKFFTREDSLFFKKHYAEKAQLFYEKHGPPAIFLARFIPIVRTFAPIAAGVGQMKYRTFVVFNVVGGFVWSVGFIFLGYFLGRAVPGIDQYILPIVLLIIIISILPGLFRLRR
ncbi:MAG: membrane-associated protein [Parcubacteria group bacterium Gr01-1014_73]|nr:MAG: membrane-associated protein [Parcubacteria group bacterium Gr01-1014_73]